MILLIVILFNLTNIVITQPTETFTPDTPLLGSNKCTWGPIYWCASPENALECNFDYNECKKYQLPE